MVRWEQILVKKVVILKPHQIVNAGLMQHLIDQDAYEVVGIENDHPDELVRQIKELAPDVLIMDAILARTDLRSILAFLMSFPNLRTIILDVDSNRVEILDKQEVQIHSMDELIGIL